jgi:hypothetical protein
MESFDTTFFPQSDAYLIGAGVCVCVCVCVCVRARARVCVCVCVCASASASASSRLDLLLTRCVEKPVLNRCLYECHSVPAECRDELNERDSASCVQTCHSVLDADERPSATNTSRAVNEDRGLGVRCFGFDRRPHLVQHASHVGRVGVSVSSDWNSVVWPRVEP